MIRHYFRQLKKNERGATAVEFAIVALLLFTLIFGIIEFGWILNGYITLAGAARDGARYAVVRDNSDLADIKDVVIDLAMTFNLEHEDITVDFGSFTGDPTTVSVVGELTPAVGLFIADPFVLNVEVTMKHEK